jgi:RHS repeat-associated protein
VRTYLPGIAAPNSSPNQFSSAVGYRYDLAGNRTRSELFVYGQTADLVTEYGFDNLNRTTSIRQSGPTIFARAVNFDYHPDGRIRDVTRYGVSSLGAAVDPNPSASQLIGTSTSKFDATTGRLESLTHKDSAGKAEVEYGFKYDAFDRIETYGEKRPQARTATNAAFAAIDKTYRYDRLDQVTEAGAESFSYAANGNRTDTTAGYATERDNRLARDPLFTYEYDREGNRTSRTALAGEAPSMSPMFYEPSALLGATWAFSQAGFNGSQAVATVSPGNQTSAQWNIVDLPAGSYEVFVTWSPVNDGLANVPFLLTTTDPGMPAVVSASAPVNFSQAPGGAAFGGVTWTLLGEVASTGATVVTIDVVTAFMATGTLVADAIRIVPVNPAQAHTTYVWDHQNRLTAVTNQITTTAKDGTKRFTTLDTTAYAYDVLGRRVAVTHTSVIDPAKNFAKVSIYDGSQVVWTAEAASPETLATPRRTQTLLWGPDVDQLLAIQDGPAGSSSPIAPVWTLTDPQGTVKDYLAKPPTDDAESGLLLTRRYSAFGIPESAEVWASGPQGTFTDVSGPSGFFYVGQEYDAETGLQYSRARYYDPQSREFISQDPIAFTAGDTNLYRRVGNSPVNKVDPSGLADKWAQQAAGQSVPAAGWADTVRRLTPPSRQTFSCVACHNPVVMYGTAADRLAFFNDNPQHAAAAQAWLRVASNQDVVAGIGSLKAVGSTSRSVVFGAGAVVTVPLGGVAVAGTVGMGALVEYLATGNGTEATRSVPGASAVHAWNEDVPTLFSGDSTATQKAFAALNIAGAVLDLIPLGKLAGGFLKGVPSPHIKLPAPVKTALPELPTGYHYRTVGGRSVVARNPGRAGDLPQMHLDGNVLKSGPVPRSTGGYWDWANVRQRLGSSGWAESGQDVHHWMIPRNGWGRNVPDVVKNQKWNLMRMPSRLEHFRVHGWSFDGQPGYNLPTRLWRGTPTPAKLTIGGGIVVVGAGYYYFSE